MMFDDKGERLQYPYASGGAAERAADGVQDYVALRGGPALTPSGWVEGERDFKNPEAAHEFYWSIADVIDAVLAAGLRLDSFHEWLHANGWKPFDRMRELEGRRFAMPEGTPQLPLMFGLVASRP
jgi:hypothetical protein